MWKLIETLTFFAQDGPGAGPPGGASSAPSGAGGATGADPLGFLQPLMMMGMIIVVFYFIIFRPQIKQRKTHEARLERLKKGDNVVTAGGIHGTIVGTKDNIAVVKIADNVKVEVQKSSINTILDPEGAVQAPANR